MSEKRFDQRRRARRWQSLRRWLLAVLAVAVVGTGVWAVWFSTWLTVTGVQVDGIRTMSAAAIRRQAAVPMGGPLARADLGAIETRVARLERVGSVEASRSWPHTVRIHVHERVPIAWTRAYGLIRQVDRHGVDFRTLRSKPDNLVEIRIDASDPLTRQQALESVAAVVAFLKRDAPDLLADVRYVSAATQDSVRLHLSGGRTVVWGSAEQGTKKLTVLRPLLRSVRATRYDVSAPELPTTKK